MDPWQLFNEFVGGVTREVEHFVDQVVDQVVETADAITDLVEEVVVESQKLVVDELERTFPFLRDDAFWAELREFDHAFWAEFWDFEEGENNFDPFSNIYGVESMTNKPQACQGCVHFHGQVYNGTPLVCGMHPYGPDEQGCPDWSQT